MQSNEPRRGIERKILRSILAVAILPFTLALVAGYLAIREAQSNAAERSLRTTAEDTGAGLRIAAYTHLQTVRNLALDSSIAAALQTDENGVMVIHGDPGTFQWVKAKLESEAANSPAISPSDYRLYDASGKLLLSTGEAQGDLGKKPAWVGSVPYPAFVDAWGDIANEQFAAQSAAPVYSPVDKELLGYVSEIFDLKMLLKFALGYDPYLQRKRDKENAYQVVILRDGQFHTLYLDPESSAANPVMRATQTHPKLAGMLRNAGRETAVTTRIHDYAFAGDRRDAFLAFERIFDNSDLFLVVHTPAIEVFRVVHIGALLVIFVCFFGIMILVLNAYRDVHNNIVRPVLLLNEGAQIIGQGDLDLKLKINTGDEIQELAMSFNKMALALKRNIRQLEESEEKYRSLITSMRDGIFQADSSGTIGFLNPAGVGIFKFEGTQEAIGQSLRDLFLDPEEMDRIVAELQKSEFVERSRIWMKRRDGRAICVELSCNLVRDDSNELAGLEGIFRDVTKAVRLERDARNRAERLSAINQIANVINSNLEAGRLYDSLVIELKKLADFDFAEIAVLRKDKTFTTRRLWPEQEAGAGTSHTPEESSHLCAAWVLKKKICLLNHDLRNPPSPFGDQFPEGTRSCLCVPLYASGRIIGSLNLGADRARAFSKHDVELLEELSSHVAVAIRNAHLLENLQASLKEVTRAREKLHEANEELKTLDEMKTNLLSNVSHELRTPLVAVMGYTDMIYNSKVGPVTDMQKEYLEISIRNIEKLVTLIENLLDFSKLHRGAETLVFDTFDLVECAKQGIQIVKPVADSRSIELDTIVPEGAVLVEGDKGKIGQVFNNLLSNAVKFNRAKGKVTIEIKPFEDSVEVSVTDTGIGIPADAQDKVFTRFYQFDSSSTRKYGGTGIGLSIAQDIVRLHGSRIVVNSELGKGTTFRFTLPLKASRSDGKEGAVLPSPPQTQLLVELVSYDRALCAQIRNLLETEGLDIIHASSAEHAAALAQRHNPDCLLVDLDPETNGNLLDGLIQNPITAQLPIVILTNDDEAYAKYRKVTASRVKRSFRKSSLLSGIRFAVSAGIGGGEPLGGKILCVDDDPGILTFIQRCLHSEGFVVDSCESGEKALEKAQSREYSLLLLDIAMPGMDGFEVCRRIKADERLSAMKIYMVTAKPIDTSSPRAAAAGADGYLLKPFRAEDLIELVHSLQVTQVAT